MKEWVAGRQNRFTSLALLILISTYFAVPSPSASATSLLADTFTNMSNPYDSNVWTVGGDASTNGGLVARMAEDSPGSTSGRLQLSEVATLNSRGFALNNQAMPTSGGIDIYFNTALYGSGGSTQADGLVFYLKSGNDVSEGVDSLGAIGGAMGYSDNNINQYGLSGALLGIGFDAYGNYYQYPFVGSGCSSPEDTSNFPVSETYSDDGYKSKFHLVVRGPQGSDRVHGYCRITTTNSESPSFTSGGVTTNRNVGVSLRNGIGANIFTQTGAAIRIKIDPQDHDQGANGTGYIYVAPVGTSDWQPIVEITKFALPAELSNSQRFKFGFVAGTGGGSMNSQIWGLTVQSLRDVTSCSPTSSNSGADTVLAFRTTTICSFTFPLGIETATVLLVGGGGGGGGDAGGGGGGGGVETNVINVNQTPWIVSVGLGGAAGSSGNKGSTGGNTSVSNGSTNFLVDGGGGGSPYLVAGAGGQGGGDAGIGGSNSANISSGAGGHGGYYSSAHLGPSAGSNGVSSSISGSSQLYGAGGGGGQGGNCAAGTPNGGTTGGGSGGICSGSLVLATNGQDWLGAGGGGGYGGTAGGSGGNGVVYIRYLTSAATATQIQVARGNSAITGDLVKGETITVASRVSYKGTLVGVSDSAGTYSFVYLDSNNIWQSISSCQSLPTITSISICLFKVPTNFSPISFKAIFTPSDANLFKSSANTSGNYVIASENSGGGGGGGGYSPPAIVAPILPGITWNPAPLKAGEPLTENQLNAKFSVPGKVTYSIPLGTIMKSGIYTVKVTFVPTDTERYLVEETTQQIVVLVGDNSQNISPDEKNTTAAPVNLANPKSIDTKSLTQLGKIYFNNNEFFLDAGDRSKLKEIAASVVENKYKSVLVFGNTDIKKGVDNTWLSRSRAQAVAKYLKKFNLNVRYTQAWFGPTRPVSKGTDPKSLKLNRRVEIYLIK